MSQDWEVIREELARLAGSKNTRTAQFTTAIPCVFNPWTITNPITDMPFTEASAWELIVRLLKEGHEFTPKILRKPAGETGYETRYQLGANGQTIYIKIQLRCGRIICRSFHHDNPSVQ